MTDQKTPDASSASRLSGKLESELLTGMLRILDGINLTETESKNGWWETSAGAEFGSDKLLELIKFMSVTVRSNEQLRGATLYQRPAPTES